MTNYYLFIDTTQSSNCVLKVLDQNYKTLKEKIFFTQNNLIDLINPELNNLLSSLNLSFNSLKKIYVNIGPGVFTGIRVGVSIAKTIWLCFKNIEIFAINSLKLKCKGHGIAFLDAKSNKYYLACYEKNQEIIAPCVIDEQTKNNYLKKYHHLPIYDLDSLTINDEINQDIISLFDKCLSPIELEPLYLKSPI